MYIEAVSVSRYRPWSDFDGVKVISGSTSSDTRGFFSRFDLQNDLHSSDIWSIGSSLNDKSGTFRGIHIQKKPYEQLKVVWVSNGKLVDVIVDLRRDSSTFLDWSSIELEPNGRAILIPRGFGHGYLTLEDSTILNYLFDAPYMPEYSRKINVRDPELNIEIAHDIRYMSSSDEIAPSVLEFLGEALG